MPAAPRAPQERQEADRRFMAAAIRLSRRHLGLTGTNPSVGTLIVREGDGGPVIVGSGVTAIGGRPHAEPQALEEAGELARGATAYVTLEPCAHHGRTPPCAEALATAGIARVVGAASDPDPRVPGEGQMAITGGISRRQVHVMRAEADAILVGIGTALADDPELTCRLPGLSERSPVRVVLDRQLRLPPGAKLLATA